MKSELIVGKILRPRGLVGEMKIETYLSSPSQLSSIKRVAVNNTEYTVKHISLDGSFGYIKLDGVDNIDSAEALRGKDISARRADLPKLPDGKYYIADLIGIDVLVDGDRIGEVVDVAQYGSADVYTVKGADGLLNFPAIPNLIKSIDLEVGEMRLDGRLFGRVVVYSDR